MRYSETVEADASIDIGPLIDIVFILLVFFMVTDLYKRDEAGTRTA